MTSSSGLGQSAPLLPNLEPGMGKSAAMLGLSAGLGGAEMELQKRLIDERMKCENHRTNYQTLKAEHASLQDEFTRSQGELKRLLSDRQAQQEKMQLLLAELQGDLLDKTRELEELRLQVMTPQRLELLRAQVQHDMEAPVRERFNKLEEETEKYRSEYNKLRYESTFLKSQCDHQREEHAHKLEEMRIRYEAEICRLEKDREDLFAQYQGSDPLRDGKRVEALLREKAQLHLRLKGLDAEVTELRAQKDNSGQQAESVQRIQIRQLTESQAAVKSLEAERQSLRLQLERMESELHLTHEQNSQLTGRLHKAEREVNSLTCQIESLKHSHKLEVASVKLECARSKGELERERDTLQGLTDGLQADVEVLKAAVERHKEVLMEKERELVRKVQSAREEEFRKTAALHEEKLEVENHLAALEQQRALQDAADFAQKEEWEERLRSTQQGEESARREMQNLRSKLQQQSSQLEELERQKAEIADLQQQNQELGIQLGTLSHSESDLMETNQRLRETLDRVREDLRTARAQAERSQHEAERLVEDRRVEWLEEKHKLQERDAELQQKYSQVKEKLQRAAVAQKKRKTLTENKEKRLQDKIQLREAKIEELELETAAAKKRSSFSEEQAQLNRRLKELQRRHNEFRRLLLGGQGPYSAGPAFLTSAHAPNPFLLLGPEGPLANIPEEQHQRELSLLRRRLEDLESAQQQQLEELGSLVQRDRDSAHQPDL
ncbi:centrosomal protein of 83 kDa isoform X1 [Sebastes umbrosus]|uniref:centrosomal protein of 83 kDa isoform X1 n=1 Tax=Sebastes umbrosus TaxID=72105 RepID=UPI00189DF8A9|nr:centrosomal protein of 83 kDa isoform X1 [Sebastes umbrosus]XP_037616414.1 centrosomal protein of 83 kDa isoform X1 [Sebastes umbrosus]XP_037616415.1 centrosomal protein of 83 kDa isoform X1 [Sebastes umbrosus]XP_037616416.1 centrosomal protein of 83 kDa isoform X1 [Sebastes umbrosus]